MNFPKVETVTIRKLDGRDLVNWIEYKYGVYVDPVGEELVPGDDSGGEMKVTLTSWSATLEEMQIDQLNTQELICRALVDQALPEGEYHIRFSWG